MELAAKTSSFFAITLTMIWLVLLPGCNLGVAVLAALAALIGPLFPKNNATTLQGSLKLKGISKKLSMISFSRFPISTSNAAKPKYF